MIATIAKALGIPTFGVWAGLIAILIAVLPLAKCAYDRSIVNAHDTEVNLNAAVEDRKADTTAADQAAKDKLRRDFEADQLKKAQDDAPKDPAISDDRERALAFHRCLSLQQRARANGLEPPVCV